jgi:hypothetical protein
LQLLVKFVIGGDCRRALVNLREEDINTTNLREIAVEDASPWKLLYPDLHNFSPNGFLLVEENWLVS